MKITKEHLRQIIKEEYEGGFQAVISAYAAIQHASEILRSNPAVADFDQELEEAVDAIMRAESLLKNVVSETGRA